MPTSTDSPSFAFSVVMEKVALDNRWQPFKWQAAGVLPDDGTRDQAEKLSEREGLLQMLHPGFEAKVFADEAEGYYLNVTAPDPRVFVVWRIPEDDPDAALPHSVTLSYNEAARWMDSQERVDGVQMPSDVLAQLREWVDANYKPPEKKQRIRPKSFESKEGRYKSGMSS
jgi:hypothetical protein